MQIMSVIRADTFTNELRNTKDRQSETISESNHDLEPDDITQSFRILRKCQNKFDCHIYKMFFIKDLKPTLNKQSDSIHAN